MLTRLDDTLYPNKVEVVHFSDKNKYIYPIFKNGKSTIEHVRDQKGYKSFVNDQIKNIDTVDVFLRDPLERFISGVETYLWWNAKDRPWLDRSTIISLLADGIIIDRHCMPQLFWIFNLARYLSSDAKIHLHRIGMLVHYTATRARPPKNELTSEEKNKLLGSSAIQTLFKLANGMLDSMTGQGWTFNDLKKQLIEQDPMTYHSITSKAQKMAGVINVLP